MLGTKLGARWIDVIAVDDFVLIAEDGLGTWEEKAREALMEAVALDEEAPLVHIPSNLWFDILLCSAIAV